ncbi:prolyl 4-hydroxylase subunit alpha-1-like isoform X3 [Amphibalanus amphitrite]|nr:prolyl 4-hydroxylase subunit alpha-1-like isoform X3 [Amphibalanus amphitrite]
MRNSLVVFVLPETSVWCCQLRPGASRMRVLAFIAPLLAASVCHGEIFTALVDMEHLAYTERELLGMLDRAIQAEEQKIQTLKKYMEQYQRVNRELVDNQEAYLHNPVNAYLVVKRLAADWKIVQGVITENVGSKFVENITQVSESLRIPDDEDLNGAAMALIRLQDTYRLNTADIASGEIQGSRLKRQLTAGDCFELGRQSYNNADFKHTALWMEEAWKIWRSESDERTAPLGDILEYLAFSTYKMGDVEGALRLTNQLLDEEPGHPRGVGNKAYYEQELAKQASTVRRQRKGETGEEEDLDVSVREGYTVPESTEEARLPERDMYEAMCRGEITVPPSKARKLKCYYAHNSAPFLLLQPIRAEDLYLKPHLVMYHDVMYDSEIEAIKQLASPRLARATVQNSKTGQLETASYRISKSAWLKQGEHPLVDQVNRRVAQLTGLNLDTAEELQVVNYGMGGHYEPHFDFARKEETNAFKSLGTGNRIATFIFYMSDVEAGGATVFPEIGAAVWPRKGSAAFWYNLHRSGEGDYDTRHAACPVLIGSKWVSNKWIHEIGQEFARPCGLTPDE